MGWTNKARGAKSRANLNRGGSHAKGRDRGGEAVARTISRRLLMDATVQATLLAQLQKGTCQPGVVVALMHYAWGKPKETVETTQVVPVKIVHVYPDEPKPVLEEPDDDPKVTH